MSKLPKVGDEEREGQYGYVHAVSGPGKKINICIQILLLIKFLL